jgi:hypothetical protein
MNETIIIPLKLLFLLGFTLHNLEEALWLPQWSKHAERFHKPVERNQFIFALIIITLAGYLITLADIISGQSGNIINYVYLGFIGMMGLNAIIPHLAATIILKKYAPGLISGMLLNLPISLIIVFYHIQYGSNVFYFLIAMLGVTGLILFSLKPLFRLGGKLISY